MARLVETEEEKAASERETASSRSWRARARRRNRCRESKRRGAGDRDGRRRRRKSRRRKSGRKTREPAGPFPRRPETRWRAAGAAAMLASQFQSTPRNAAAVTTRSRLGPRACELAGAERPLAEVMETLATLSRRMDDQGGVGDGALSPAATSASARAALDCVVAATGDAAETLAEIEESLRSAKARRAARKQRESSQFSRGRSPLTNGEDASRSAPSGERLAGGSFSFFDRDAGAVAAAEAVAARVAETRETRRPQERPTPMRRQTFSGADLSAISSGRNEDEDAFKTPRPPRVSRWDEETPVRARLAAMAARLTPVDSGFQSASLGSRATRRAAREAGGKAQREARASKARRRRRRRRSQQGEENDDQGEENRGRGKNAKPDPYDVLAMLRRRAASPSPRGRVPSARTPCRVELPPASNGPGASRNAAFGVWPRLRLHFASPPRRSPTAVPAISIRYLRRTRRRRWRKPRAPRGGSDRGSARGGEAERRTTFVLTTIRHHARTCLSGFCAAPRRSTAGSP